MAAIHDLLAQVQDETLRERLEQEINKLTKTKKFGLVFEEHIPECTPLYDVQVKRGGSVAKRAGAVNIVYEVSSIKDGIAICVNKVTQEKEQIPVEDLVSVAEFGEPIYPYLKPIDSVCNAPDSDLWHTLIEADNYHALQLLEYLYAGKVDCIYIDPPYNTGAKDWKYNNNYVDGSDEYRHSKWLSMMEKRLKLAKKLLNPEDSVLIVTIDEKEYLHLGCLLEELFPAARMQMVSDVINPRGATRDGSFSRSDEYIFIIQLGNNSVYYPTAGEKHYVEWYRLRRTDHESRRGTVKGGTQQFYPIYVDVKTEKIVHVGEPLPVGVDRNSVPHINGAVAVFPIKNDGTEMNWGVTPETLRELIDNKFVRVRKNTKGKPQPYLLHYISFVQLEAIREGKAVIEGYNDDGTAIVVEEEGHIIRPGSAWNIPSHNAGTYGSEILATIIGEKRFNFPKSVYSVLDDCRYFLKGKPEALVVDFFAGSGTTLHAVNLLNAEDGGRRRCIMVTNNEVSAYEEKKLVEQGYAPGDSEWDALGIARYVTWPRTVCSIEGHDVNGKPLKGNYLGSDIPMSEGFQSNAIFFKLGFLDKTSVALGRQLAELFPVLWMKAGAHGPCPELADESAVMAILPENRFAILIDERHFAEFEVQLACHPEIDTLYFVTDSDAGYREMISKYQTKETFQLYKDYLDNFRINTRR
jgi:adenine-specific DNA-methyltransferase